MKEEHFSKIAKHHKFRRSIHAIVGVRQRHRVNKLHVGSKSNRGQEKKRLLYLNGGQTEVGHGNCYCSCAAGSGDIVVRNVRRGMNV